MAATLWFAEQRVNTTTTGVQSAASIAKLSNGGFVIVWQDAGSDAAGDIKAQIFNAAGVRVGSELTIASGPAAQTVPEVVAAGTGFRVVWDLGSSTNQRLFDAVGNPTAAESATYSTVDNLRSISTPEGFFDVYEFGVKSPGRGGMRPAMRSF